MSDQLAHLRDTFGFAGIEQRAREKAWDESRVNRHPAGDERGGQFAPKDGVGGGADPGITDEQRQRQEELQRLADLEGKGLLTLNDFERKLRLLAPTFEVGAVFDADGKLLFTRRGDETSINWPYPETAQFSGATMTHNHPQYDSSLSPGDVHALFSTGLAEIRAVTTNYVHIMRNKSGKMDNDQWSLLAGMIRDEEGTQRRRYFPRVYSGEVSDLEYHTDSSTVKYINDRFWHETWVLLENKLGDASPFTYTREKRNGS